MAKTDTVEAAKPNEPMVECGIIMPIATTPGYPENHWEATLELISRGVRKAGMAPQPVWANGPADVIQERIIRNLYEQPFAVCDVSGLNPNVMFELGIRLAFGKPTIIVNDEVVRAPFDIGPSEYVPYDRSLHYQAAENFVTRLSVKIEAVKVAVDQQNYRPYIKTFGPLELGTPGSEAVPLGQAVLDQVASMAADLRAMKLSLPRPTSDALDPLQTKIINLSRENYLTFNVISEARQKVISLITSRFPDLAILPSPENKITIAWPAQTKEQKSSLNMMIRSIIAEAETATLIG